MRSLLRSAGAVAATWFAAGQCWCTQSAGQGNETATFGTTVVIPSGLRGLVYYLTPGQPWLPDFAKMKPVGAIYTTSLNVPVQDWSQGFPGVTTRFEWFAIDYRGRFWISTPGNYEFLLTSDDGSKLYIDDRVAINLDGLHVVQTEYGKVKLDCGMHTIRVSYFQGPRYQLALVLAISGGGKKWRTFSTEEFKPPENPEDWTCGGVPVPYDPNRRALPDVQTQKTAMAFETEALGLLHAQPRPRDVTVRSAAYHFWRSAAGCQSSIAVGVPGTSLSATRVTGAAPADKVHVALFALVRADDGSIVDKFTIDAPYVIPDRQYAEARAHDLVFSHPVHLPVGHYTLETAVMDREGQRAGTAEVAVESPPQRSGIELSSLVLVDSVEPINGTADAADPLIFQGKRVVPHLGPVVNAGEKPMVYFVVYPDSGNPSKPALKVEFLNGGRSLAEQTADLPPPDSSGAIQMFVALAPRPGDNGLKITVFQGNDSVSDILHYQAPAK
jgi:hypothetical protein